MLTRLTLIDGLGDSASSERAASFLSEDSIRSNHVTVVTNSEFLSALDEIKPLGTFLWVNSFIGDPNSVHHQEWKGVPYRSALREMVDQWGNRNTYFSTAALKTPTGRTKDNFSRLLVIVADDVSPDQIGRAHV